MKYRFNSPFFEPHPDKDEIAYTYLAYDIGRYFFEVVRNLLVVGAIKFFADKTGHWALHTLFWASLVAFTFLFQSFFFSWRFKIFAHFMGNAGKTMDVILSFFFTATCVLGSWIVVISVANQIAAVTR